MDYQAGSNLTLNFVCHKLPRELKKGDKIMVSVFKDKGDPDDWLFFNIPVEGYTSNCDHRAEKGVVNSWLA